MPTVSDEDFLNIFAWCILFLLAIRLGRLSALDVQTKVVLVYGGIMWCFLKLLVYNIS